MQFANPAYFCLLILIVPFVLWYIFLRDRYETTMKVASTEGYRRLPSTWRTRIVHAPFLLRMLAFVLIVFVLARPQTTDPNTNDDVEGIDIMMAMDVSVSMLTRDLSPNRIEAAKAVGIEFINGRRNDNIGLSLFGGEAFTQCPMTTDHGALLSMFQAVNCDLQQYGILSDGTAIGMGLTNAVSRLATSKSPSKVVILITDGANNTGDISPLTAAEIAKSKGIRVYTIAVGKQGMVRQPVAVLPDGSYQYAMVKSDMDPETLKQIAEMTGGLYYAADNNNKLREIYKDIDRLERVKLSARNYSKRYEAFMPFGFAALLSLLLEMLLRLTVLRRIH